MKYLWLIIWWPVTSLWVYVTLPRACWSKRKKLWNRINNPVQFVHWWLNDRIPIEYASYRTDGKQGG